MVKIIAPIHSVEGAEQVVAAGADEIYCGVRLPGMKYVTLTGRPAFCNLPSYEDLAQVVHLAHERQVQVALTVNLPFMTQLLEPLVRSYLEKCMSTGVDSLIVGNLGILLFIHQMGLGVPIYASSFLTVRNHQAADFLHELGVTRIVAPQDITLNELRDLVEHTSLEVEAFAHGEGCSNVGGNCYLIHTHRPQDEASVLDSAKVSSIVRDGVDGDDDSFIHIRPRNSCLFCFDVYKDDATCEHLGQLPILDAYTFCSLCRLPEIISTGVKGLKLVGRGFPIPFQAETTRVYRRCRDLVIQGDLEAFHREVSALRVRSPALADLCSRKRCYFESPFAIQEQ